MMKVPTKKIPEKIYERVIAIMPILTIDILLKDSVEDKFILLLRNNPPLKNKLWTPGGRIFKNENFNEAASRKIEEELGIKISPEKFSFKGVLDFRSSKHRFNRVKNGLQTVSMIYECTETVNTKNISIDSQSKTFELSSSLPYPLLNNQVNQFIEQ